MTQTIDISIKTILKFVAIIAGIWIGYLIRDVLMILFIVLLLSAALEPTVARLTSWRIPRVISILIVYFVLALVAAIAIYVAVPPLVAQLRDLANNLPAYVNRLTDLQVSSRTLATQRILDTATQSLSKLSGGVFTALATIFGGIFSALTVLTLTFYMLVEEKGLRNTLIAAIPHERREKLAEILHKMSLKLGLWLRGQLSVMIVVAILDSVGLMVLNIPYPLALGLLAGLLELMPIIGPIIAGMIAVLIAFASGAAVWQLIVVVILYVLVQQIESQVLVPKIMNKAIGVSPVVIIIAILVGAKLLGLVGAIIAIPIVAVLSVIAAEYMTLVRQRRG